MKHPAKFVTVLILLGFVGLGLFVLLGEGSAPALPEGEFAFDGEFEPADPARPALFGPEDEFAEENGRTELGLPEDAFAGPVSRLIYRGRVIDPAGTPVPGASIRLATGVRGPGRPPQGQAAPVLQGKSLTDGSFAITAMAPRVAPWSALVEHPEFAPVRRAGLSPAVAGEVLLGEFVLGPGGLIEGRVVDEKENGVAGAKVTIRSEEGPLRGRGGPGWAGAELEGPAIEAVTAAGGAFRLAKVPRGELRLVAQHKDRPPGRSALVRLEDGARVSGVKIVLDPGLKVAGIVSAEGQGPLAGARVSIPGQFGPAGRGVLTDEKGAFSLPPLAPGRYELAATAEGWQPAVTPLTLEAEKPPQPIALTLKAGALLAGQVVDKQGKPVTLFAVRVLPADLAGLAGGQPGGASRDAQGRGQGRGRFGQEAVARGQERAQGPDRAREAGFGRGQGREAGTQAAGVNEFLQRIQERMGGQGLPPDAAQRIQEQLGRAGLSPEALQQMQQRFQGLAGNAADLAQTAMNLMNQALGRGRRPEQHPEGKFQVQGLLPARYLLEVRAPGYQAARSEPLDLTVQASITGLRIAVEPTLAIAGRVVARATGQGIPKARVMALPAERQEGGRRGAGPGMRGMGGPGGFGAETDGQGRFRLEDLAPGSYSLRAFAEGHGQGRAEGIELALGTEPAAVEIVLSGPARLVGRVTGFSEAERPSVMVAAMGPARRPEITGIAADGTYELAGLSPGPYFVRAIAGFSREMVGGLFRSALQPGGQQPTPDITLEEDQVGRMDLALWRDPQGSLLGTLTRQGAPAVGARVELERKREELPGSEGQRAGRELMDFAARMMGGPGGLSSEVDVQGGFKFTGLEPGTYTISATAAGRSRANLGSVAVFADQVSRVDLLWGAGGLAGSLLENGLPVVGAQVRLRSQGAEADPAGLAGRFRAFGAGGAQATTDAAGNFRFQDLSPGRYTVEASRRGQGGPPQTLPMGSVEIYPDQESRLDLVWSVASLRVRVVSETDGRPLAQATIFATGAADMRRPVGRARTDESGEAVLENLPPGPLRLFVMVQGHARGELEVNVSPGAAVLSEVRLKPAEPGAEGGLPGGRRPGGEGMPGGRRPGGEGRRPGGSRG